MKAEEEEKEEEGVEEEEAKEERKEEVRQDERERDREREREREMESYIRSEKEAQRRTSLPNTTEGFFSRDETSACARASRTRESVCIYLLFHRRSLPRPLDLTPKCASSTQIRRQTFVWHCAKHGFFIFTPD